MNTKERKQYETMLKIRQFGEQHAADFPVGTFAGDTFTALNQTIETLRQFALAEDTHRTGKRQGTTVKSVQRENLVEDLRAINRSARAMARRIPGVDEKFRVPLRGSDREFITTARRFAAEAESLQVEFLNYELPADFLADLREDITAFEKSLEDRTAARSGVVTATAAIDEGMSAGLGIIRDLDAVVRNRYRNDPTTLAAWVSATHVPRPVRVAKTKEAAA
jgi:hypothetical protein